METYCLVLCISATLALNEKGALQQRNYCFVRLMGDYCKAAFLRLLEPPDVLQGK